MSHPPLKDLSPTILLPESYLTSTNANSRIQLSLEQLMTNLGTNLRIEGKEHDPAGN
jgi:hypothetical protein